MAESSPERSACYAFGDVVLDVARRRITRHGEIIALGRRGFDVLLALVQNAPGVVTHDDLAQTWF